MKVKNLGQLQASIRTLIEGYNAVHHLHHLKRLIDYSLTEQQFALLVGRCKLYQHLPNHLKQNIPALMFENSQTGAVVKDYYNDQSFCRSMDGSINLWKLYNLFTGSNKSTYIDQFLDRPSNAYSFVEQIRWGLEGKPPIGTLIKLALLFRGHFSFRVMLYFLCYSWFLVLLLTGCSFLLRWFLDKKNH